MRKGRCGAHTKRQQNSPQHHRKQPVLWTDLAPYQQSFGIVYLSEYDDHEAGQYDADEDANEWQRGYYGCPAAFLLE